MRYITALILLLCASTAGAGVFVGFGQGGLGPVYTDCSNIESWNFYYTVDHLSGDNYACKTSSIAIAGIADAGWDSSLSSLDPGIESPESGNNVSKGTSTATLLRFAITSGDIFSSSSGFVSADVYIPDTSGNAYIFYVSSGSDSLDVYIDSSGTLVGIYRGSGGTVTHTIFSSAKVPDATWTTVQVKWSVANSKFAIKVGANAWQEESDALAAFATEPSELVLGKAATTTYIDNFRVSTTSGY